jgi:ABC-type branched-subunit amino acid transport system substrate-binding protein
MLDNGVRVAPSPEHMADWRSDYSRTAVMIYNKVPTFDELMDFAQRFEKEFNEWVQAK